MREGGSWGNSRLQQEEGERERAKSFLCMGDDSEGIRRRRYGLLMLGNVCTCVFAVGRDLATLTPTGMIPMSGWRLGSEERRFRSPAGWLQSLSFSSFSGYLCCCRYYIFSVWVRLAIQPDSCALLPEPLFMWACRKYKVPQRGEAPLQCRLNVALRCSCNMGNNKSSQLPPTNGSSTYNRTWDLKVVAKI